MCLLTSYLLTCLATFLVITVGFT